MLPLDYRKLLQVHYPRRILLHGLLLISFLVLNEFSVAQTGDSKWRGELLGAAREIIQSAGTCALITIDEKENPQVRTMDAFAPENDFTVWLATNPNSRKVSQIKKHPDVVLFYNAKNDNGYVSIHGRAELVDDKASKQKYWKEEWAEFYPDRDKAYLLIRVKPQYLELINYKRAINGDSATWKPVRVEFKK